MSTKKNVRASSTLPRFRGFTPPRFEVPAPDPDLDPIDWTPIAESALVAAEWALDRTAELVGDDPEEAAIVARVRVFVHGQYAGIAVPLAIEDLAFVMGLLIQRLGHDRGADDIALALHDLEPLAAAMGVPRSDLRALHRGLSPRPRRRYCPGAPGRRVRDLYIHTAA